MDLLLFLRAYLYKHLDLTHLYYIYVEKIFKILKKNLS